MDVFKDETHEPLRVNNDTIDRKVIESLKAGDHMSFNRIYVRYHGQIMRFVNSLIKSFNDAEEITQQIFIAIWEKKEQIDPDKNFNGYMYRMARNSVINYCKARVARSAYPIDKQIDVSEYVSSEDIVIAKEVDLIIELTIARMPQQRRKIFEMSRYEGLSNDEIADRLCVKKTTVEKQVSYAKKEIREVLAIFILLLLSR